MCPPGTGQGPACTVAASACGGSNWRRLCTPANSPAGWLAATVTVLAVTSSWYPLAPTLAGAPDSRSRMPVPGAGLGVDGRGRGDREADAGRRGRADRRRYHGGEGAGGGGVRRGCRAERDGG